MHWLAFIVALMAFAVFVAAHFGVQRKWATIPLGLALLTAAWVLQLVIVGGKHLTID